ncbi:MIP/aquaporin family protein [Desulfofundulus thermocisternus]|uniref:MIP/aquaporin family protein n=1 Tax=Desulfofundulus thermocisternus TaxID=42471 RepID=UPI0019E279A2|nr:MIP/aquaporin family protein [Desulfofundulus thermocisternus]MBE3585854.1 aquaporin family protein [Thermoanaerobacter sp.]MCS5696446.1 aquaporin family protein [Desulfofundulus thermocisternus]
MKGSLSRELLAEMMGVAFFIFFGDAVVAALILVGAVKDFVGVTLAWGLAIAVAVYMTAPISGAHLNPAVTIAFATMGKFPWRKVVPFCLAQTAGGFIGAALVYALYWPAFKAFEAAQHITRGSVASVLTSRVFCTFRSDFVPDNLHAFIVELVLTALLMFVIMLLTDQNNNILPLANLWPFMLGLFIVVIGLSAGCITGYAMNPARDFGPRLFAALTGWGRVVLPGIDNYFWVPILGPIAGAITGGFLYNLTVGKILATINTGVSANNSPENVAEKVA